MTWFLGAAALTVFVAYLIQLFAKGDIPGMVRAMRWLLGGLALAITVLLAISGRIGIAMLFGILASSILRRGRLGPIDFNVTGTAKGAKSHVNSHYFKMQMDHDTSDVSGSVVSGAFTGRKLMTIDEFEMRSLLQEVTHDPDSLSLLETWLDANRSGWREYFEQNIYEDYSSDTDSAPMDNARAYEILGLQPGASEEEIKAAHHRLLKVAHPDQGGSNFLASRINAAKDFLLDN